MAKNHGKHTAYNHHNQRHIPKRQQWVYVTGVPKKAKPERAPVAQPIQLIRIADKPVDAGFLSLAALAGEKSIYSVRPTDANRPLRSIQARSCIEAIVQYEVHQIKGAMPPILEVQNAAYVIHYGENCGVFKMQRMIFDVQECAVKVSGVIYLPV